MEIKELKETIDTIISNINTVIVGKEKQIKLLLTAVLAEGHILLEDVPGTGKTMLAKTFSKSIDANFKRIQFTPDLLPSDLTGINVFNQKTNEFNFICGPAFTNILLADEINRATPRTQSSLLEVMEERQITVDGETRILDKPFIVIATENPIENAGTFNLPEAQLDRFMIKLSMGYPEDDEELLLMNRFINNIRLNTIESVCNKDTIIEMQDTIKKVYVHKDIQKYIYEIVKATRNNSEINLGVSPRGTLAFLRACQSYAAINGRNFVTPDDVKDLAIPVLSHRIIVQNTYLTSKINEDILIKILDSIDVPTEDWEN
ncbi:MoxR family ATPase [Clostridium sp. MSJ-8]|uniref:AAA family ATPase n=1 Tax=Clostridium sp. MSJ-8 TaxID=2841510 RepID=UPI001C0EA640|nr:MoxR family ATPase [Clostridium sp. MSJ-8]MBU5488484.1 MoxR family ATPase [Clostridium sp. MSJ-8]